MVLWYPLRSFDLRRFGIGWISTEVEYLVGVVNPFGIKGVAACSIQVYRSKNNHPCCGKAAM